MNNGKSNPKDMLPLPPITYLILFNLIGKELHGYEILKLVEGELGQSVPAATLYRHIRKMLSDGMIEMVEKPTSTSDDPRRKYYKLTPFGHSVYVSESARLKPMVNGAQSLGGLIPAPSWGGV